MDSAIPRHNLSGKTVLLVFLAVLTCVLLRTCDFELSSTVLVRTTGADSDLVPDVPSEVETEAWTNPLSVLHPADSILDLAGDHLEQGLVNVRPPTLLEFTRSHHYRVGLPRDSVEDSLLLA